MPSECLQNCPRNVERSSSSEDSFGGTRTAFLEESRGERGILTLLPGLANFVPFLSIFMCIMTVLKSIMTQFANRGIMDFDY